MFAHPFAKSSNGNDELSLSCAGLQNRVAQLTDILEALLAAPPAIDCWPEWMHRAAALMSQYDSLVNNFQNLLFSYVVIPQNIVNDAVAENVPNILLRTRLAPDVEDSVQKFGAAMQAESAVALKAGERSEKDVAGNIKCRMIMAQLVEEFADELNDSAARMHAPMTLSPRDDEGRISVELLSTLRFYFNGVDDQSSSR